MKQGAAWIFLVLFAVLASQPLSRAAAPPDPKEVLGRYDREIKPLIQKHCFQCHGGGKKKGGVILDEPVSLDQLQKKTPLWLSALEQVSTASMPPEESQELPKKDRDALANWIRSAIEVADTLRPKDPGFVALHRLNRTEYNNTICDLTGIDFKPADDFPADDSGYGFDNIADVLTMSPLLAEKYIGAAEQIIERVMKQKSPKIFVAAPSKDLADSACAEKILRNFATRAFRRPVRDPELKPLLKIYEVSRKNGSAFEAAIGTALTAALVSPHFLFRVESKLPFAIPSSPDNPTSAWPLDDFEVAVRMSYFLWSTMPDDELNLFASQRALQKPSTRGEQVKRMLQDRRSNQLISNFAGQWLELRNLDEIVRDPKQYPNYNPELADFMQREATMFFESIVREDKSILTLIDADYTYINETLAQLYGIPNIKGKEFQKVSVKGSPRGGIITMSSTMTLTANPARTSPVKRGKWVLEQILGSPPPPPPPEVPSLVEKSSDEAGSSLRQRLEKHRADPNCATCHNRMDGLGFALENFDSIGRWRDSDGKFDIDAAGTLPGGDSFKGPQELKAVVMKRKMAFVRNFVEKMMVYALGRGIKPYDRATITDIVKYVEQNEYRFSSVVTGIVHSDAFLKRREKRGEE